MVDVRYKQRPKKYKLTISGHAGAGPEGHDLVCAGVSALANTVPAALTVEKIRFHYDIGDGYFEIRARDGAARSVFRTVVAGLEFIKTLYPELIRIDYV